MTGDKVTALAVELGKVGERVDGVRAMAKRNECSIKSFGERLGNHEIAGANRAGEITGKLNELSGKVSSLEVAVRNNRRGGNPGNGNGGRYVTFKYAFDLLWRAAFTVAGGLGIYKLWQLS